MKRVMQQFEDRTSQRFHEYEERMQSKRMQCKEQCDKEIQKIILKDKIEKEFMEKFSVLETDIQKEAIPTCVCEKSVADKTEKFCLNCGKNMGAIAPGWGLICGVGYVGWTQYAAATVLQETIKKGVEVGLTKITEIAAQFWGLEAYQIPTVDALTKLIAGKFTDEITLPGIVKTLNSAMDVTFDEGPYSEFAFYIQGAATRPISLNSYTVEVAAVKNAVSDAKNLALTNTGNVTTTLTTTIIASIVAIVVIILVMVIIYLILRYRRKKKMKKKLQYLKLLKE
ncbi:hypothetical protein PFNF54_04820 [Plasmodium falciparum NF54]|uniref:Rifin n=1 Tax=Plasmodium falciparum (isolate NF54) TaxID=5843 RepID=W7JNY9_PLAFO|nr:hypothetical protein PFNF54_04820 [Plasmodium falciparum NF54]